MVPLENKVENPLHSLIMKKEGENKQNKNWKWQKYNRLLRNKKDHKELLGTNAYQKFGYPTRNKLLKFS